MRMTYQRPSITIARLFLIGLLCSGNDSVDDEDDEDDSLTVRNPPSVDISVQQYLQKKRKVGGGRVLSGITFPPSPSLLDAY